MRTKAHTKLTIPTLMFLALLFCGWIKTFAQTPTLRANGKIAFASWVYDRYARSGIFVMNPDGSGRTQLTSGQIDQLDYSPSWSPDGKQIAFIRNLPVPGYSGPYDVFVMNADGSNQRQLTRIGSVSLTSRPSWSPDGTKIAFVGPPVGGDYYSQIYVMNADGSGQRAIGRGVDPDWSPDGSKLAFATFDGLYIMNPDGSGRTRITAPQSPVAGLANYDSAPAWSPDATRIVFSRSLGCDWDDGCESITIWTVNADGSNQAQLADIATYESLAWSPDGTKIVFRWLGWPEHSADRDGDLFTIEADGSHLTRLTNTPLEYELMPSWQPVASAPANNPIDDAQFFVRQHYLDFLNREPDPEGLTFWTNSIIACGTDLSCVDAARVNVSAAFYLSIEFQQTGYEVYRFYKSAFGNVSGAPVPIRFNDFLADAQTISQGVIVNQGNWQQQLETNTQNFANTFVQRQAFTSRYANSMTPEAFVDALFANAGVAPASNDRSAAIAEFGSASDTADVTARARALRRVADNGTLVQQEFNRAFVLMEYFGYLRRNPNDAPDFSFGGYNFWLDKLDQFHGNFVQAEMVRAFLVSIQYRQRFLQP